MGFDKAALIKRFKTWCYETLDKSATSSYMNYKAACRAKSTADMINKLKIVEEETDETCGWLEIISDRNKEADTSKEQKEGDELLRISVASIITLRRKGK